MSIYSESMSNTPCFDMIFEDDICTVCTYDCSNTGVCVALDALYNEDQVTEEWTPEAIFNMQFLISEKLHDKGYTSVNLNRELLEGEYKYVLQLEHTQVCRFVENMNRLGYTCEAVFAHKRRYRWVVFKDHTPMDLLHVYHYLDVIV